MALPTSGQISLSEIQAEFGGSNPIGLDEYAARVGKTATAGQNISFSDFHGLSNLANIIWANKLYSTVNNNTSYTFYSSGGSSISPNWLDAVVAGSGSNFEMKATITDVGPDGYSVTGITPGSASWTNLGSSITFNAYQSQEPFGENFAQFSITIQEVGNAASAVTATLTLENIDTQG